ncbi:uncharacterized protein LOC135931473 [Gordionus sp. m RMFG-2023]|uniref:uncharacterized protein LOC135931473 n=1 Tax=Gordionus sp. m RMFG-2023 TaxID=3053472 RepID=UPI0031FC9D4E
MHDILFLYFILFEDTTESRRRHRFLEGRDQGIFRTFDSIPSYPDKFRQMFHMHVETFNYILTKLESIDTTIVIHKNSISMKHRLYITLIYLTTGMSFRKIALYAKIGKTSVSTIVTSTCRLIWIGLQPKHLCLPTVEQMLEISAEYFRKSGFPHIIGSIDGKHVKIKQPKKSGSTFYNYKKYNSIVIQGISDDKARFMLIEVGFPGSISDRSIFSKSLFYEGMINKIIKIPNPNFLPSTDIRAPYVFVGDDAYPLLDFIMKPYKTNLNDNKSTFNTKLSKARVSIERCFGIMSAKFRHLYKPSETNITNTIQIVKADCLLHNIIIDLDGNHSTDINHEQYPILNFTQSQFQRWTESSNNIRETFNLFVNNYM